jgi:hypothetical protein
MEWGILRTNSFKVFVLPLFLVGAPTSLVTLADAAQPLRVKHRDISNEIRIEAGGFRRDRQTGELVQAVRLVKTGAASTGRVFLKLEGLDPSLIVNAVAPAASANDIVLPVVTNAAAVLKPDAPIEMVLRFRNPQARPIRYRARVLQEVP